MVRIAVFLASLFILTSSASEALAQHRRPLQQVLRRSGFGWGPGYHYKNPGPDIDYYNPWSPANTPQHSFQGMIVPYRNEWPVGQGMIESTSGELEALGQPDGAPPLRPAVATPSDKAFYSDPVTRRFQPKQRLDRRNTQNGNWPVRRPN